MRTVVSVATHGRFVNMLDRFLQTIPSERAEVFRGLPPGSPTHKEVPFGFKIHAIKNAMERGATVILWCDSSALALRPLNPLWEFIEHQGYWFSKNYGYSNGEFTCDEALKIMGITRDEAKNITHLVGGVFGLDMRTPIAQEYFRQWEDLANRGAFNGPHETHRHDQSCMSHVVWEMGLKTTTPPEFFAEQGWATSDKTVLTVDR